MCKVIMFTNISKIKNNQKLVDTCQDLLSSQRDGFGYVYQTETGMAGQRSNNLDTFKFNAGNASKTYAWSSEASSMQSNQFGQVKSKITGPAMFHGRISTNNKDLVNVHPLTYGNGYLIHNGVVTDHGPKYTMTTNNDTEHLLNYMERGQGIDDIASNLTGYYAFGYIGVDGRLTIARDGIAPLYSAWLHKLQTFIFATTEELIEEFCESYKLSNPVIESMASDTYLVFNGNDLVEMRSFKSRGYGYSEASLAHLSLGYDLAGEYKESDFTSVNDQLLSQQEIDCIKFINSNITEQCFIELNKTQLTLSEYKYLTMTEQFQCDVYNVHGEMLMDLWLSEEQQKGSAA